MALKENENIESSSIRSLLQGDILFAQALPQDAQMKDNLLYQAPLLKAAPGLITPYIRTIATGACRSHTFLPNMENNVSRDCH